MKSRAALYEYFNETGKPFTEASCKELNQKNFQNLVNNWKGPKHQIERFQRVGQEIEFMDDSSKGAGPLWVYSSISYTNSTTSFKV
jgi:UDP-N-acetylmuramoylalanine-D-glutamate ligase